MPVWRSEGQAEWQVMDYQVNLGMPAHVQRLLAIMDVHARPGGAVPRRRIGTLLGHLTPDVLPGAQFPALRPIRAIRDRRMPEDDEQRDSSL